MPDLDVRTRQHDGVLTALVRGVVTSRTAPLLRLPFDSVYARRPATVEIDLTGATFADGQGLLTVIAARRRLAARNAEVSLLLGDAPDARAAELVAARS